MAITPTKCLCSPRQLLLLFLVLCSVLFLWFDETTAATLASKMNVSMNYFADNDNNSSNTIKISKILAKNNEIEQELLNKSEELKNSKLALQNYKKIEEELNNKLRNYKEIEQELANKSMELTTIKEKYSKLYSQHIKYKKDSIISIPSTTVNSNNNTDIDPSDINLSLKQFLKQYKLSTIIEYIREIESSIYFDRITNDDNDINKLYFSGESPHFYDGAFDLSPGKTCKVLRWPYYCTPHAIIDKAQLNEWTLRINETKLNKQTKHFLSTLQTKYNFYTNVYKKFIENLKKYNSPYMEPINIYFFGNSHMKQIFQGIVCLMDDIEINIFNHSYNRAVYSYHPRIRRISAKKPDLYNFNDTVCGEFPKNGWEYHRNIEDNGLGASFANESLFKKQRNDKNIEQCDSQRVFSKFMDGTNNYIHFNHNNRKRMEKFIKDDTQFIMHNVPENEMNGHKTNRSDGIRAYFENQDIIIFNIGNQPAYRFYEDLEDDLKYINHTNKPVLFLSQWWDWMPQEREMDHNNLTLIHEMQTKYPNLIWLNLFKRDREKLFKWNNKLTPFHYGKYRWLIAEGEPRGHLCQPGVPEHHILAITELINLLLHVYQ